MIAENPNRRQILKTVSTLSAGLAVGAAGDPGRSLALASLDDMLREAVATEVVRGIVAIGATENGVIYEGAFGPSMTPDSVFWIASMTKAITAAACMQLVEQGKL